MSKIDELIAQFCPKGVPSLPLGEVAEFNRGTTITKSQATEGAIPVLAGGQKPAYWHNQYNRSGSNVVIAGSGAYAGFVTFWEIPIWVSDAFTVTPKNHETVLPKYLYYLLISRQEQLHNLKQGSGIPHVYGKDVAKISAQIPPIEVQREIVSILDKFTQLEAELEAELEARRKQFNFYRDSLLTFSENEGGVRWIPMGELGSIFGGLTGKSKGDFIDGNSRYISYVNIFNNAEVDLSTNDFVKIHDEERQRPLKQGDILFTGSSETADEVGMSSVVTREPNGETYLNSFSIGYRWNDPGMFIADFAKHLFRSYRMRTQIVSTASGVTRFNVSKQRLSKVMVPIVPLNEQKKIAAVLNNFEDLSTSMIHGIPAEIAARRKQYEYYRDKLLTFKDIDAA